MTHLLRDKILIETGTESMYIHNSAQLPRLDEG
jgi:hypothetical protein